MPDKLDKITREPPAPDQLDAFMRELWDTTHPHPFSGRERLYYLRDQGEDMLVIVEIWPYRYGNCIHISSIVTPPEFRGRGAASYVLKEICKLADKHQVVLDASVKPFGTPKGLNKKALLAWYRRAGFTARHDYITRKPR